MKWLMATLARCAALCIGVLGLLPAAVSDLCTVSARRLNLFSLGVRGKPPQATVTVQVVGVDAEAAKNKTIGQLMAEIDAKNKARQVKN